MRYTRRAALVVAATAIVAAGAMVAPAADAVADGRVCDGLDSGKVDTTGDPGTVTVTAPAGKLIAGYCVKAGSVQQGNGPEYVTVDPPRASVTFGHSSGKAVSHYSVRLTSSETTTTTVPTTTVPTTTVPTTTVPTTTVPTTTVPTTTVPPTTTTSATVTVLERSAPEAEPVVAAPSFTG